MHVAEDANGPVGAIRYDDDARTTVVQEVFTNSYYRPDDLVEPARHPIPPGQSREWTSTFGIEHFGGFLSAVRANAEGRYGLALELVGDTIRVPAAPLTIDAGLGRLLTETTIAVTGSGASQTLQSETHLRNISSDPVTISYLPDFCNVQLRGYATADRSGPPAWKTGGELCGYRGEGDRIEPGEVSFAPQRSVPDIIDELLGTAPRQHYYVSFVITLNGFRIERPAGEARPYTPVGRKTRCPRYSRAAASTIAWASGRLPSTDSPAAFVWPPPPNCFANPATSTLPTDRSDTFTRPLAISRKRSAMRTPSTERGNSTTPSRSSDDTPHRSMRPAAR